LPGIPLTLASLILLLSRARGRERGVHHHEQAERNTCEDQRQKNPGRCTEPRIQLAAQKDSADEENSRQTAGASDAGPQCDQTPCRLRGPIVWIHSSGSVSCYPTRE